MRFLKDSQVYDSFDRKGNYLSIIISLSESLQLIKNQRHTGFYFKAFR